MGINFQYARQVRSKELQYKVDTGNNHQVIRGKQHGRIPRCTGDGAPLASITEQDGIYILISRIMAQRWVDPLTPCYAPETEDLCKCFQLFY